MELELQHGLLVEILLLSFCLYHERRRQDEAETRTGAPHAKICETVMQNMISHDIIDYNKLVGESGKVHLNIKNIAGNINLFYYVYNC